MAIKGSSPQHLRSGLVMPRHRHAHAYVALVLAGGYVEAGDLGRWRVGPGDALVHDAFDAHLDCIGASGARVLNLPFAGEPDLPAAAFRVRDPDVVVIAARRDLSTAIALCRSPDSAATPAIEDWPDLLAGALRAQPELRIDAWAARMGLAPATVSRGFRAAYGVSPARFRAEARARIALRMLRSSSASLAAIAHEAGFADQPHLSRAIVALTGSTPGVWRRSSSAFKTAAADRS